MLEAIGIKEIIKPENLAYRRSDILTDKTFSYCPGCGHATANRILAEVIGEGGLQAETIGISPVGCSVLLYEFLDHAKRKKFKDSTVNDYRKTMG